MIPSTNDGVTIKNIDDQILSHDTANNTHKDTHEIISEEIVVQVYTHCHHTHSISPIEITTKKILLPLFV